MSTVNSKTNVTDSWKHAQSYEDYMGRWSRLVAPRFLDWLGAPRHCSWLEVGCGTGALTQAILAWANPEAVLAIDPSPAFVAHARAKTVDSRVEFAPGTLEDVRAGKFDLIVSGLVLNFLPRPYDGLATMKRLTADGGTIAAYVWDYGAGMESLRRFWDTAVALDGKAAGLDESERFPICRPEALRGLFEGAGLRAITVDAIDVATEFKNFEDYWRPFESGQGPAPSYVSTLDARKRAELKRRLSELLLNGKEGAISLTARAWAVKGSK